MKKLIALLLSFILLSVVVSPTRIRAQSQAQRETEDKILLKANEVLLDVVVRDKKGRAVKDLKPTDFEIYEDNQRQEIAYFRLVSREPATTTEARRETPPPVPTSSPNTREPFSNISLIAMVFDRLSPNARNLANKAATNFIDESLKPDDLATVCVIDLSLRILQQYTNDPQLLKQAVERAATLSTSSFQSGSAERRTAEGRSSSLDNQISSQVATANAGGPGSANTSSSAAASAGAAAVEQALTQMNIRALETFEALERDQQGYATMNGLMAIINSLRNVPGRKAIVFFSEGLALPPAVQLRFRSVINAANRANVSVYSIDAAGLRVESNNAEAAREISALGNRRLSQNSTGREDRSGRPMTMQLERNEDLLKLNPQSGLSDLANETGGFLIGDTNDLSAGLRRIDEDIRTHYELTYTSKNQNYDGRFRQINVKLARSGYDVQTRKGYYAVMPTGSSPVLEYEAAVLATMSNSPQAAAFPLRLMGFNFPEPTHAGLAPVVIEVPANSFTFTANKDNKSYGSDFTILALIKDESQQVVSKLSQHYTMTGPIEGLEAARRGDILFYKEAQLPPGRYTIEAAAYDAPSKKVSVKEAGLEVMAGNESSLRMSNIVIIKRAERLSADEQKVNNPFHFGELVVYPNLGEALRKSTVKQLPFYFNVYLPKGSQTKPNLAIEVIKQGKHLARINAELPSADQTGRIQYASAIPLESFQPGSYELRITVSSGQTNITRTAAFTVEQ